MKKLLSMELKRGFLSPILWIGILVEIGMNVKVHPFVKTKIFKN